MSVISDLERDFLPGYSLTHGKGGMLHVQGPGGKLVRTGDGAPIAISPSTAIGYHQIRRYRSELIKQGVIKNPPRRKARERHSPRKAAVGSGSNPLVMAQTVLQSPSSSSKERTLAKEVLRLYEQNDKLRELSQTLGKHIKKLEGRLGDI